MFRTTTAWRLEDLREGMIIYCPPHQRIDPKTMKGTGELQKFKVGLIRDGRADLTPYHGPKAAQMPPERD